MIKETMFLNRFAPHYRKGVFIAMGKELNIDFYFGNKKKEKIKKLDYGCLISFKKEIRNIEFGKSVYWQKEVIKLVFKPYTNYILMGDMGCITTWIILILNMFFPNKNTFIWTHGWYGDETKLRIFLKRLFFSFSKGIFLYGDYAKKIMVKNGFNDSKLHVIYNSLDYDFQITLRNRLSKTKCYVDHFKNENKNLIFIGRLTLVKKLQMVLEALSLLKKEKQNYNLTFIGDGDMLKPLQELTNQLGLSQQVYFYGACYEEEKLSELIYNADLCISPGNVGLTAMHSLTFGTPVITHNLFSKQMPEFEAIHEDVTGGFFEFDSVSSLSEKITDWFNLKIDREYCRLKCFEIIDQHYNPAFQVKVMKNAIKNVKSVI